MRIMRTLIFIIVGILILGCIGVGIIYFTTDIFQSNQNMFYKYLSQENVSDFFDTTFIRTFIDNLKTESSNTNGKIIVNAKIDGEQILKNAKVAFDNNLDNSNELFESKIVCSDNTSKNLLGLDIVRNKDTYGVMVEDVITQYLAIENNDLKKFTNKLGFNANKLNIPDKIEIDEYANNFTNMEDKIEQDLTEIFAYVKNQVSKESFYKISKTNIEINEQIQEVSGYNMVLNNKETTEIFENLDEGILEKLKTFVESFIDEEISDDSLNTEVILYIKDKNLVKINILIKNDENLTINLSKTFDESNVTYGLEISQDDNQMICNIVRSSETDVGSIVYNLKLLINSAINNYRLECNIETNTTFSSDLKITKFDNKNCVIANNMESATLIGVLKVIGEKIYNETGFKNSILGVMYDYISQNNSTIKKAQDSMANAEVEMHNSIFTQYEGEQKGTAVKSLINIIETNNATSGNVAINILYNNSEESIEIDTSSKYIVSFEYNNEGYIKAVNIKEQE